MLTVRYPGGTVRAPRANLEKLNIDFEAGFQAASGGAPGPRRPYGYRRRSNAAAGTPLRILFSDNEEWTYRVTGPLKNFITEVVIANPNNGIVQILTPRGAEFSKDAISSLD